MSDERLAITATENGPYQVEHGTTVTKLLDGTPVELRPRSFLCRCGGSKNKPFCDGTHVTKGFTGAKDPERVRDHVDDYATKLATGTLTIHDNRGLCAHAGRCTDNLSSVFKLGEEPWIDPNGATAEKIIEVISMCPSGALSYSLDGVERRDRGGDPMFGYVPGGPYVVAGGCDLVGEELPEGGTTDHLALCRCGESQNKPFCSGKHWYVTFDEDVPLPPET